MNFIFNGCLWAECACGHWHDITCIPGWLYPRQLSLGQVTFPQTWNFLFYKVSCESCWYQPVVCGGELKSSRLGISLPN